MTISNHAQTHSNGTKKNGEKAIEHEGAKNGEKAKQPESTKGAATPESSAQSETHPKNGAPKGFKKENGESKATKRHSKSEPDKPTGSPGVQRVLGYRGHCEEEDHFPTGSLLLPDLETMKRWVDRMANTVLHLNCAWKAEELFVAADGRLFSRTGEMDQDHPGTGLVDWSQEPPFDLGPLSDLIPPERLLELAAQGFKEAAIQESTKSDAPAQTNGEKGSKPIGESQPAPKPSHPPKGAMETKASTRKPPMQMKGRKSNAVPVERRHPHAMRAKPATKQVKRA